MNNQVIITKEPGQIIPRGYLQEALKKCPTCLGMTIQDVVDNEPVLDTSVKHGTMAVDDLMKVVESCKDVRMVIVLGDMHQDFDPETDIQPYVFQQKDGDNLQDILAFHCEGNFPNYSKPGKGHTDEYHFWEDCVFPTLLEKFQASGDLDEFFVKVNSSQMKQICENPISHRGVVVFVPLTGDIIAYGINDLGGKFDWGTTSQTFGWGDQTKLEQAAETVIAGAKKAGSRLSRLMGTASETVTAPAAASQEQKGQQTIKTDDKGIHHTSSGNDPFKQWPGTSSKTHTMMAPPVGLQGNAKNRWIRLFTNNPHGDLPKNKDHSNFMCPVDNKLVGFAQEAVTTNDEVKQLVDKVKKFQGPSGGSVTNQQMADAQAEVQRAPKSGKEVADSRPTADFLPECPPEEATASAELVTEWATNPKQPTSLEVQRIESKWPLFTVSRGITLNNVARWSIADKKLFVKRCPNDAARLISELVLKLHEFGAFEQVNTEEVSDKQNKKVDNNKSNNNPPPQPGPSETQKTTPPAGKKSRLARLTGTAA